MPHSQSVDALVLKTYDVGEADRFCVLFTREKGRVTARASGVRKPGSRLGGTVLPFRRLTIQIRESGNSYVVTGAVAHPPVPENIPLSSFYALSEGVELLLKLVTDQGELPDAFEATLRFFHAAFQDPSAVLTYHLALCHTLGLLPENAEMGMPVPQEAQALLTLCRKGECPAVPQHLRQLFTRLRDGVVRNHLTAPLRAAGAQPICG